jgi:hypothetical protein
MRTYAKKTCNICGLRDIQPNMFRVKKSVAAYTSKDQIGFGTWVGAVFGGKISNRRIQKTLFANNKRRHTAHRTVWMCEPCSGENDADEGGPGMVSDIGDFLSGLFNYCLVKIIQGALIIGAFMLLGTFSE